MQESFIKINSEFLNPLPMHPNHHHRGGVELAVLEEEATAVCPELRVGFVAEDQVLVDADCTGAVGDRVVVAFRVAERERREGFVGIARDAVLVEL